MFVAKRRADENGPQGRFYYGAYINIRAFKFVMSPVPPQWTPEVFDRAAAFVPLHEVVRELPAGAWPRCEDFNEAAAGRKPPLNNSAGQRLRFVPQQTRQAKFEDRFEPRVYLCGEVQMRPCNWHDT